MKNDTISGRMLSIMSTIIVFIVAFITGGMYYITGYYIYFFLFITSVFVEATNLLFIILKIENTRYKNPKPKKIKKARRIFKKKKVSEEESVEIEETAEKKKKFSIHKIFLPLCLVIYAVIYYFCCVGVINFVKAPIVENTPIIVNAILFLIVFIIFTVFEKLCKFSKENATFVDAILQNFRVFFRILIAESILGFACVIVESFKFFNIQKYIGYVYTGLFFYYLAFITISLLVTIMRKELIVAPYILVPIPFIKNQVKGRDQGFLDYLEENTGITIRSLWSIKYIRDIAPTVVFMIALLLWLSTGIVQVESYQQGAIFRIGKLQDRILKPGIHLTLPYPFDKVEIYDTKTVNKTTIGYKATTNADNIWTEGHEGEEYKLLLGGGDEVVSINLRLEYKISDLKQYLTTSSKPEMVMEALAYELVTDKTIATDLASLMSADRNEFSQNFQKDLSKLISEKKIGIEVVAVILESIHPPVEIAWVYQELISAEIKAEKYKINAQDVATVTVTQAETTSDTTISGAQVSYEEKVAKAKAGVAEFMASLESYNVYSDGYMYQKRMAAIRKAYVNAKLVILGEGIDSSAIYFGNFAGNANKGTEESTKQ